MFVRSESAATDFRCGGNSGASLDFFGSGVEAQSAVGELRRFRISGSSNEVPGIGAALSPDWIAPAAWCPLGRALLSVATHLGESYRIGASLSCGSIADICFAASEWGGLRVARRTVNLRQQQTTAGGNVGEKVRPTYHFSVLSPRHRTFGRFGCARRVVGNLWRRVWDLRRRCCSVRRVTFGGPARVTGSSARWICRGGELSDNVPFYARLRSSRRCWRSS